MHWEAESDSDSMYVVTGESYTIRERIAQCQLGRIFEVRKIAAGTLVQAVLNGTHIHTVWTFVLSIALGRRICLKRLLIVCYLGLVHVAPPLVAHDSLHYPEPSLARASALQPAPTR